jgi:zinc protease
MRKITLLLVVSLLTISISFAQTEVIRYQLDNGFTVILNPDNLKSEVFGMVVANAGGKHDPATATGLAHYMEHMLFKGTQEIGTIDWEAEKPYIQTIIELYDELAATTDQEQRAEIQRTINEASVEANKFVINNELWSALMEMGGTGLNAGTSPDATYYYNTFPPGQIEKWLEIYSHRFIDPVFRGFQAELEVVYEEKNMYSDMFIWNLLEAFQNSFFKNHPYGQQSLIGSVDHLKNPQLSKMIDFYQTYYVANNMSLVLVGNFDVEQVKPIIEEKFSRLKTREQPEPAIFAEEPFKGREFVSGRYSPIKLGLLGFRSVPKLHPDKLKLEVANGIMSNTSSSGLLDQLMLDNKLMAAQLIDMPYLDHGATILLFVPKILGQSTAKAEGLVMQQIEKLKKGEFDEQMVEAIKKEKYREFQLSLENYNQRGMLFADAFLSGEDLEELFNYPARIMDITREDIIEVANKYYGSNYLAFHSKMGSAKGEKIDKPGFEPVISNLEARSEYVQKLDEVKPTEFAYQPIDFNNDVKTLELKPRVNLFVTENPVNDIFGFTVRYRSGHFDNPEFKHLATAINYAGTTTRSPLELKTAFANLGCTYNISSSDNFFRIDIKGPEQNLEQAIVLVNDLMQNANFPKTAISKIWEEEKLERKMEAAEPASVARALLDFVRYGQNSPYLARMGKKEIRKLKETQIQQALADLRAYEVEFHYAGSQAAQIIAQLIESGYTLNPELKNGTAPINKPFTKYDENTVFFVNNKKALQSNIYFFVNGQPFDVADKAAIDAFNTYFGGAFSGIVMQEIREFRSLSYAASANYVVPDLMGKDTHFVGYVGTQADKTIEALDVYTNLLTNLPQKPDRMQMIRNYLTFSGQTARPDFRNLSFVVQNWKNQGFDQDPYLTLSKAYQEFDFDHINDFHARFIKDNPIVVVIVGDKKRVDMDALAKFGKMVELNQKDLYKN